MGVVALPVIPSFTSFTSFTFSFPASWFPDSNCFRLVRALRSADSNYAISAVDIDRCMRIWRCHICYRQFQTAN